MQLKRLSPTAETLGALQTKDSRTADPTNGLESLLSRLTARTERASAHNFSQYHTLLESMGVAVYTIDAVGRLTFYNEAASMLWGWRPPLFDQVWCGSWRLFAPDGTYMPHDTCPMVTCLHEARPIRGVWAYAERPDGSRVPFAPFPTPLLDVAGSVVGAINVLVDISGVRAAEEKYVQSEARFRAAQEVSPEGFVVLEAVRSDDGAVTDFTVSYSNPAAVRLLKRLKAGPSLVGAKLRTLLPRHVDGPNGLVAEYSRVIVSGEPSEREHCIAADTEAAAHGRGGKWFRCRTVRLGDGVAISFEDITVRRRAEFHARFLAEHDELTGLMNRRGFQRVLGDALAVRDGFPMRSAALLILDLDRFKSVNDTFGHPTGDALLRTVAKRLLRAADKKSLVARLSGDEFAILIGSGEPGPVAAASLAKEIVDSLAWPVAVDGQQIRTGTSIGIALAPADGASPQELLKNADVALYRAKTEGRGRWAFFAAALDTEAKRRRLLDLDLRRALQTGGEFEVYYQPIFNAATRNVVGMEALVRWQHPIHGLIGPSEFIALAEEVGLIVPLGELVLRMACAEAADWPEALRVAVNLSPVQFRHPQLLETIKEALSDSGLQPQRLELEVTEALLLEDIEPVRALLNGIRALGIQIALDDFGVGYSSLAYLHNFPFDRVKIDKSFSRDIDTRPRSAAIVRAVAGLAAELGMAVTAEGIETDAELAVVQAAGCKEIQGFLLSPPRSATDVRAIIAGV